MTELKQVLCRLCTSKPRDANSPTPIVRNNDGSMAIHMKKFHPNETPRFAPLHLAASHWVRA